MADISCCGNQTCPQRMKCHRYTVPPSDYQWYSEFKWDDKDGCEDFWDNKDRTIREDAR